jgi:small subunit ribosomal protein S16
MGATKRPFFRVVVTDQRNPRDGRFIENIGKYHPLEDPSLIEIDEERAMHWLRTGAQPSQSVQNLLDRVGIWAKFSAESPSVRRRAEIEERNARSKQAKAERAQASKPKPKPKVDGAAEKAASEKSAEPPKNEVTPGTSEVATPQVEENAAE